jgi:hypothetical protein
MVLVALLRTATDESMERVAFPCVRFLRTSLVTAEVAFMALRE